MKEKTQSNYIADVFAEINNPFVLMQYCNQGKRVDFKFSKNVFKSKEFRDMFFNLISLGMELDDANTKK